MTVDEAIQNLACAQRAEAEAKLRRVRTAARHIAAQQATDEALADLTTARQIAARFAAAATA